MARQTATQPIRSSNERSVWSAIIGSMGYISGVVLLSAAIAYLAVSSLTPRFAAQTDILVKQARVLPDAGASGYSAPISPESLSTQAALVGSAAVIGPVVSDLRLDTRADWLRAEPLTGTLGEIFGWFGLGRLVDDRRLAALDPVADAEQVATMLVQRGLTVTPNAETGVLTLDFEAVDPDLAAAIANGLAERYIAWQSERTARETDGMRVWLDNQIKALERDIAQGEAAVRASAQNASEPAPSAAAGEATDPAEPEASAVDAALVKQLDAARDKLGTAKSAAEAVRTAVLERNYDSIPPTVASNLLQRLLAERSRLRRDVDQLSATLLPRHPRMRQLRDEQASIVRQLAGEADRIADVAAKTLKDAERAVAALEARAATQKQTQRTATIRQVAATQAANLELELKTKRELLTKYRERLAATQAQATAEVGPIFAQVIRSAEVPSAAFFPRKWPLVALIVAIALAFALLATIVGAALANSRARQSALAADVAAAAEAEEAFHRFGLGDDVSTTAADGLEQQVLDPELAARLDAIEAHLATAGRHRGEAARPADGQVVAHQGNGASANQQHGGHERPADAYAERHVRNTGPQGDPLQASQHPPMGSDAWRA